MLAALVVAGTLLGRAGLPIAGALLLVAALVGGLPQSVVIAHARWSARGPELVAVLAAFLTITGVGLALAWPSLLPLGLSVDAVHHYQLVHWIAEHQALPPLDHDTSALMGEMTAYPPGLALVVVALATLTNQPPLETLYPTVVLLGGLNAALVVLLATSSGEPRMRWRNMPLALVGPMLMLMHRTYTFEAYTSQSYYAMVLGVVLLLLAAGWLIVEPQLTHGHAAQLGLVLAALVGVYPLWAPIPAVCTVIVIAKGTAPWRRRLIVGTLALLPALLLALIDLPMRLRVGQLVLAHEGFVALPTPGHLIPILLALPAIPLLCRRHGRRLAALAGLTLAALLALWIAAQLGRFASYHSYKLLFVLTPLAAASAGAAAMRLAAIAHPLARRLSLAAVACVLVLTGGTHIVSPPAAQVLTPELVAAARWLAASNPHDARRAIAVGAPTGPLSYWLQIGLLGQRRDKANMARQALNTLPPSPEGWVVDEALPKVVVVPDLKGLPPGAVLEARFGAAAVLRRSASFDLARLDPLLIRYRTFWEDQRLKTSIELQHYLPGRMPILELRLANAGTTVGILPLQPNADRVRPQYLGMELLPATLSGSGYINRDSFPALAPPAIAPTGAFSLTLRLTIDGTSLDERLLATFERTATGQFDHVMPGSGELIYLRRPTQTPNLRISEVSFAAGLLLTGWSNPTWVASGDAVEVTLRWQAPQPIDRSLFTELDVVDAAGRLVATSMDMPQQGFYPTWRWRPGEDVEDQRQIRLPADLSPGTYRVQVSVRDLAIPHTLVATDQAGGETSALVGEFVIE